VKIQDDRIEGCARLSHTVLIAALDKFMSGWGKATGGKSYAVWACKPEHADAVEKWVESRDEMKSVKRVGPEWLPSGENGHCHIYVVNDGHPSLVQRD